MIFKRKITTPLAMAVGLTAAAVLYWYFVLSFTHKLNSVEQKYPNLEQAVKEVEECRSNLKASSTAENYVNLGFACKSLADQVANSDKQASLPFYKEALKAYEDGIIKTNRRNTLFLMSAGNMKKYLGDYAGAAEYFKEAISVSPGDVTYYVSLAELYEYDMRKSKAEILAVYEQGLKMAVMDRGVLESRKKLFLERNP